MSKSVAAIGKRLINDEAASVSRECLGFSFGQNWRKYLSGLEESNVEFAMNSFCDFTRVISLRGHTFLDLGCGSGLSSLIAHRLGAARIVSVDIDQYAVACAKELHDRFAPDDETWRVYQGSVLDNEFLRNLGRFSYVYCWGVVHHTGAMWRAIESIVQCVEPHGKLHLAVYNEHRNSAKWLQIKRTCNKHPLTIFPILKIALATYVCAHLITQLQSPIKYVRRYATKRGMSFWRDIEDWLGGLPYEYCRPDQLTEYLSAHGFSTVTLRTTTTAGCNEFLLSAEPRS